MEDFSSSSSALPKEGEVEQCTKNVANEKLKLTCSISAFQSNNINSFRNNLYFTLRQVIEISKRKQRSFDDDDESVNNYMSYDYVSYDSSQIEQSLTYIGWKDLCQYHDNHIMRQQRRRQQLAKKEGKKRETTTSSSTTNGMSTPLEEVISAISKPMIIPRCCVGSILYRLMKAFIEAPKLSQSRYYRRLSSKKKETKNDVLWTSRWSPAQTAILKAIKALYVECFPFVGSTPMNKFLSIDFECNAIPNEWNRLLSLANTLAMDIPRLHFGMTIFVIDFIRRIDDVDISKLVLNKNNKSRKHDGARIEKNISEQHCCCPRCGGFVDDHEDYHQTRKRKKKATLANLHDQDLTICDAGSDDDDNDNRNNKLLFKTWYPSKKSQKPVSLKDVLKESITNRKRKATVDYCRCIQKKSTEQISTSSLSQEWNIVRSKGYKKFLCIFEHHDNMTTAAPMSSMRKQSCNRTAATKFRRFDIYQLLELAHKHYTSPSIRICFLMCLEKMAVEGGGGRQYVATLKVCWQRYLISNDEIWLRIYSEILVEFKICDDRQVCWDLIFPILQRLLNCDFDCLTKDENHCLFRCVGYILSRRCRIFQEKSDKIKCKFQLMLTSLKIRYGESRYWVDDKLELVEKERTLEVLEKTGILGLVDLVDGDFDETDSDGGGDDDSKEDNNITKEKPSKIDCGQENIFSMMAIASIKSWPFHEPFDVRSTCSRLGIEECTLLLSSPRHDMNIMIIEEEPTGKQSGLNDRNCEGHEILEFFDQDIFRLIFSYFGYKRLVMMREVCQMWKSIVDESNQLWYGAYRARFRVLAEDPMLQGWLQRSTRDIIDWKKMFVEKLLVEQSINHQRNATTGWKYRICRYIGCNHVLKSAKGEMKHYEIHSRKKRTAVENAKTDAGDARSSSGSQRKPQKALK